MNRLVTTAEVSLGPDLQNVLLQSQYNLMVMPKSDDRLTTDV